MDHAEEIRKMLDKKLPKHRFEEPKHFGECFFVSSGSILLDLALRDGEFPSGLMGGKSYHVYGEKHSGKTAIAIRWAREYQKLGGLVVWLDCASEYSRGLGEKIGVDHSLGRFIYVEPYGLEHVLTTLESITEKLHDQDIPVLFVVDPVGSKTVQSYMMDDSKVSDSIPAAAGAKKLHEWFRRGALWYASGSKISYLWLNHLTADPRPYGQDKTPLGSAISYYAWVEMKVSKSPFKDKDSGELGAAVGPAIGNWMHTKIVKNKMAGNYNEAEVPFYYQEGFNPAMEAISYLISRGKLEKVQNRDGKGTGRIKWGDQTCYIWQLRDYYLQDTSVKSFLDNMVRDTYRDELAARRALR